MKIIRLALVALSLLGGVAAHAASSTSPIGTWRTFDDSDGKESGTVEVFERDGLLYGRITRILDPAKAAAVCAACSDDRKDKPVLGMQIIRGLKAGHNEWDGGEILDPRNGKLYDAKLHVSEDGQKLLVRGFLGISLFGRTQTWLRG